MPIRRPASCDNDQLPLRLSCIARQLAAGRKHVIAALLLAVVATLDATILFTRPNDSPAERRDGTNGSDAIGYWALMMRDKFGRTPRNALMGARAQVDRMRADAAARRGASGVSAAASAPWRWLGPGNVGGRIRTIASHPTIAGTILAGSAGGGIWKTTNGGASWAPVTDFMPALSVNAIVFDPTNANVVYASTGEPYHNGDAIGGAGVFKSIDGGTTWTQLPSLAADPDGMTLSRMSISPDGRVLLVSGAFAMFRSADGGASFTKASVPFPLTQVAFNPSRPLEAVAAGYGGTAIYSRDGGLSWAISTGFAGVASNARVEVAWANGDPDVVYASADQNGGWLFKSVDGGATFTNVYNGTFGLVCCQGFYAQTIWVNPFDSNHVLVGGGQISESFDGGRTWKGLNTSPQMHVDQHAIVSDARFNDAGNRTVYIGNDGGVYKADDIEAIGPYPAQAWVPLNNNLGVTQFYGAAANLSTGVILGGTQDTGMLQRTPTGGTDWPIEFVPPTGDDGRVVSDQTDPNYFYTTSMWDSPYRSSDGGRQFASIGFGITDARNANFVAPLVLDPNNPQRLYVGGSNLWRSDNAKAASPTFASAKPPLANAGNGNYLNAIAVMAGAPDVVWVGYNFGDVYRTANGTSATPVWQQVSVPTGGAVTSIHISEADANTIYVTTSGYSDQNVWKSVNGGAMWTDASGSGTTGLPSAPVFDLQIDPEDANVLYAGTEVGVFVSADGGAHWQVPSGGPANTRVVGLFWIGSTLIAATHGRGLFALDTGTGGGAPALTITPAALDFSQQAIDTSSAPRSLMFANSGTASLSLQSIGFGGAASGDYQFSSATCAGTTLAPGASCTTQIVFRPTATGSRSATVIVSSNATGSPNNVPLSGTGIDAGGPLPAPWTAQDVGAVSLAGSASYSNGTFTIAGSGADIWGTADAFRFAYQTLTGDGTIVARVATEQAVNAWTKSGLMIRQTLAPDSAHASLFVTPAKGVAFQWRTAAGGVSASSAVAGTAPKWLRLIRAGNTFTSSISTDGSSWTSVGSASIVMSSTVLIGLPITSHDNTQLAAATIDSVTITATPPPPVLPPGWQTSDVGATGKTGSASESSGTFTVGGAGADVWGTADAFRYAYAQLAGDGTIVAHVAAVQNVNVWTKAGVMLRQSLDPGAAHASMFVTPGKGLAFQRRPAAGGASTNTQVAGAAPKWVKIARAGGRVTASVSNDGASWMIVGDDTVSFSGTIWAGLAVSSHDATQLAQATFDHVSVTGAATLPEGWQHTDVGNVGVTGNASASGGVFTVSGSGADIWNGADAFHFAYRTLAGDGELVARVASVANTYRWAKAGVMIRQSAGADSAYAMMLVSAAAGTAFQYRSGTGASALSVTGSAASSPYYVRIVRSGTMISGYQSSDGAAWQLVGSATIPTGASILIGLAVSSHDNTKLCTATFDHIAPP